MRTGSAGGSRSGAARAKSAAVAAEADLSWSISSKNTNLPKWWHMAAWIQASAAASGLSRSSAARARASCSAAVRCHSVHQSSQRWMRSVVRTKSL
jgi:hypothetical protein